MSKGRFDQSPHKGAFVQPLSKSARNWGQPPQYQWLATGGFSRISLWGALYTYDADPAQMQINEMIRYRTAHAYNTPGPPASGAVDYTKGYAAGSHAPFDNFPPGTSEAVKQATFFTSAAVNNDSVPWISRSLTSASIMSGSFLFTDDRSDPFDTHAELALFYGLTWNANLGGNWTTANPAVPNGWGYPLRWNGTNPPPYDGTLQASGPAAPASVVDTVLVPHILGPHVFNGAGVFSDDTFISAARIQFKWIVPRPFVLLDVVQTRSATAGNELWAKQRQGTYMPAANEITEVPPPLFSDVPIISSVDGVQRCIIASYVAVGVGGSAQQVAANSGMSWASF